MDESQTTRAPGRPGRRKGSGARAGIDASWGLRAVQALADPSRWRMMLVLGAGPRSLGELARQVDLSPACTSHHVSILKEAELVETRRQSRAIECSLPTTSSPAGAFLASIMAGGKYDSLISNPALREPRAHRSDTETSGGELNRPPKVHKPNLSNSILMEDFLF